MQPPHNAQHNAKMDCNVEAVTLNGDACRSNSPTDIPVLFVIDELAVLQKAQTRPDAQTKSGGGAGNG